MHGMIHQAARGLVLEIRGETAWQDILSKSGLNDEHFVSAQSYGDDVTFTLISEIVNCLGLDREVVLEEFGRYWLKFAEKTPYGSFLAMAGDDLETFLNNLDRMHSSVSSNMPKAVMPTFSLAQNSDGKLCLEYRSKRNGMEAFVSGLIAGLLDRFGQSGEISMQLKEGGADFAINLDNSKVA